MTNKHNKDPFDNAYVPFGCGTLLGVRESVHAVVLEKIVADDHLIGLDVRSFHQAWLEVQILNSGIDWIAPWLGEIIFDVAIFGMTLYKALTLPRGGGIGLLSMIIRDGMYLILGSFSAQLRPRFY